MRTIGGFRAACSLCVSHTTTCSLAKRGLSVEPRVQTFSLFARRRLRASRRANQAVEWLAQPGVDHLDEVSARPWPSRSKCAHPGLPGALVGRDAATLAGGRFGAGEIPSPPSVRRHVPADAIPELVCSHPLSRDVLSGPTRRVDRGRRLERRRKPKRPNVSVKRARARDPSTTVWSSRHRHSFQAMRCRRACSRHNARAAWAGEVGRESRRRDRSRRTGLATWCRHCFCRRSAIAPQGPAVLRPCRTAKRATGRKPTVPGGYEGRSVIHAMKT